MIGKSGIAAGDLEQVLGLQALLPQRRPPAGVGARDEQRARGVLAEARTEQRRAAELGGDRLLDLLRLDQDELCGGGKRIGLLGIEIGQVQDDAVVGGEHVGLQVEMLADACRESERPGRVDAAAVGGQHAQPPVADLIAEALEHDRALGGQHARGGELLAQVRQQIARRALVEVVVALEGLRVLVHRPAGERPDRLAELLGTADRVALPEGHRTGRTGSRGDDHAVACDLLDPPGRGAQQERLTGPRLIDHLLVELPHAAPVGERDREQAAVGNRPGVGHRELARPPPRPDRSGHAIPDDARAQLAELLRRVAPVEHVEHVLEQLARELGVGVGARDERVQLIHRDARSDAAVARPRRRMLLERPAGAGSAATAIATIC